MGAACLKEQRVALVTGAANGIGAAVCSRLLRDGYRVAAADLADDGLKSLEDRWGPKRVRTTVMDVRCGSAQQRFVDSIESEFGPIEAVVPCAGVTRTAAAEAMSEEEWKTPIEINLTGAFLTCQAAARFMLRRGRGAIVCVASLSAKGGQTGRVNYAASKFGTVGMVKSLAIEWGREDCG